jgi:shikimate kinase
VWLDLPFEELLARIPPDGRRPLATDLAQMTRLYEARRLAYEQAHVRLDAARLRPEELIEELVDALERQPRQTRQ